MIMTRDINATAVHCSGLAKRPVFEPATQVSRFDFDTGGVFLNSGTDYRVWISYFFN
jgi:hypothetical protein